MLVDRLLLGLLGLRWHHARQGGACIELMDLALEVDHRAAHVIRIQHLRLRQFSGRLVVNRQPIIEGAFALWLDFRGQLAWSRIVCVDHRLRS